MNRIDRQRVTTANELHALRVVRQLGVVRGITVRSRSIVGNFGAALQTLVGGDISLFAQLCERARQDRVRLDARTRCRTRRQCRHRDALRRQRDRAGA